MSDGRVHDTARIDFMSRYISQMKRAVNDGVNIEGYFAWSFRYEKRFGLIHVDYQIQERTLKNSSYWYRKVIESNGNDL
jgi:beta-glucosidase